MSASAAKKIWAEGTAHEIRIFVRDQDWRFQEAMRAALAMPPAPKPERPNLIEVAAPPIRVRDILHVGTSIHKLPFSPVNQIIAEVCRQHRVSKAEIFGHRREKMLVLARHEAFYRLKSETTLSLPSIGMRMGGKDHSTVLHGIRKHQARMAAQ